MSAEIKGVFPAHAGMSPTTPMNAPTPAGFPRSRGDEPLTHPLVSSHLPFSPLTRG